MDRSCIVYLLIILLNYENVDQTKVSYWQNTPVSVCSSSVRSGVLAEHPSECVFKFRQQWRIDRTPQWVCVQVPPAVALWQNTPVSVCSSSASSGVLAEHPSECVLKLNTGHKNTLLLKLYIRRVRRSTFIRSLWCIPVLLTFSATEKDKNKT